MINFLKCQLIALGTLALIQTGCTSSLDGGSINLKFEGVSAVTVTGPETVEIDWTTNPDCVSYKVYQLSSSTSQSIVTVSVPPVKVKKPTVLSDHTYTFAVACVDKKGTENGLTFSKTISTWAKFSGVVSSRPDESTTPTSVILNWNYPATTGTVFQVYANLSSVPGDFATWSLHQPGGDGTQYTETPICETYNNQVRIGNGGDCNAASLLSGNTYNFKIVARYPDNTYSADIVGNATSIPIASVFNPPNCVLTKVGMGADVDSSSLFLRCSAGGTVTGS